MMFKKTSSGIGKYTRIIDKKLTIFFFYELGVALQMDILFPTFINMRDFFIDPFSVFINSTIALIIVAVYLRLLTLSFVNSLRLESYKKQHGEYEGINLPPDLKEWVFLKEEYRVGLCKRGAMVNEYQMIRDFMLCFFVTIFVENPLVQILPVLGLYIFTFGITVKHRPYSNKYKNFLTIINEGCYLLILTFFLVLEILAKNLNERTKYLYIGYPLIGMVTLTMVINLVVFAIEIFGSLKKSFKKCKNRGKEEANKKGIIHPEETGSINESNLYLKNGDDLRSAAKSEGRKKLKVGRGIRSALKRPKNRMKSKKMRAKKMKKPKRMKKTSQKIK